MALPFPIPVRKQLPDRNEPRAKPAITMKGMAFDQRGRKSHLVSTTAFHKSHRGTLMVLPPQHPKPRADWNKKKAMVRARRFEPFPTNTRRL
jgi:hypothetical protein